ncbi:MAG TPA: hypothetical protein ENG14_03110 [Thermodesulforhabdus norvegica]|uniref:Uncharacterized protein n=1 Tax=Thermodesulforhabdus norvegica TaxID=39841 RepID=A0A7C0WSX6_9BACT|nr:hypothetical protein [Deltaproteobacteria bacterium]MBW2067899.1 hypothetical protein [Deltaproteobacteria bacterium]HDL89873.1 hypothetical protein [Thermodesulforhabdus norvegica]
MDRNLPPNGVTELLRRITELEARVASLEANLPILKERHPVEQLLAQRGQVVLSYNNYDDVILPLVVSEEILKEYYDLLKHYSFRLFLRDLISHKTGRDWRVISKYCSVPTLCSYMTFLQKAGLVEFSRESFEYRYLGKNVRSFGPTLEWHVHEVLKREFLAPTVFGVKLKNTPHGGDYDVISVFHGSLVYVEVKSSPPRGVELPNVEAFLNRLEDINPNIAVFLVDTELRMKDKIVKLFEEITRREAKRLVRELFYMENGLYLINAQKGIVSNLRLCFQHFFKIGGRTL